MLTQRKENSFILGHLNKDQPYYEIMQTSQTFWTLNPTTQWQLSHHHMIANNIQAELYVCNVLLHGRYLLLLLLLRYESNTGIRRGLEKGMSGSS